MGSSEKVTMKTPPVRIEDKHLSALTLTHEEILKSSLVFMETLRCFHSLLGTTQFMVPVIGGQELDLHLLYVEVTKRGGFQEVVDRKEWEDVSNVFDFPPTTNTASDALKEHYSNLLRKFEQFYFLKMKTPLHTPKVPLPVGSSSNISATPELQQIASNSMPTIQPAQTAVTLPVESSSATPALQQIASNTMPTTQPAQIGVTLPVESSSATPALQQIASNTMPTTQPGQIGVTLPVESSLDISATPTLQHIASNTMPTIQPAQTGVTLPVESSSNTSATPALKQAASNTMPIMQPAQTSASEYPTVTGWLDGKFEHGYIVSVKFGSEILSGVLYHPLTESRNDSIVSPNNVVPCGGEASLSGRKRSRCQVHEDGKQPKPKRSGYNFFFAEEYARLKPLGFKSSREITRTIGRSWRELSPDEKLTYQKMGVEDKERYEREVKEYRERTKTGTSSGI